ncbi:hypothetical protein D3C72_1816250 [compost metagenome]
MGGSGRFLHQRGVLLRHLVELVDGGVDLADAIGLFVRCRRDLANDVAHAFDRAHDLFHGGARVLHQARAGFHTLHRRTNQRLDLARGLGTAPGQ